jgi:hypothetical protein
MGKLSIKLAHPTFQLNLYPIQVTLTDHVEIAAGEELVAAFD